jgi:hypothetical protein
MLNLSRPHINGEEAGISGLQSRPIFDQGPTVALLFEVKNTGQERKCLPRRPALDRLWQSRCRLAAHFSARFRVPQQVPGWQPRAAVILNVCLEGKRILVKLRVAEFPQQIGKGVGCVPGKRKNLSSCSLQTSPTIAGDRPPAQHGAISVSSGNADCGGLRGVVGLRAQKQVGSMQVGSLAVERMCCRAGQLQPDEFKKSFGRAAENTRRRNHPGMENFNGQFQRIGIEPRRMDLPSQFKEGVEAIEDRQIRPLGRFSPQSSNALRRSLAVVCTQGRDHLVGQGDLVRIEKDVELMSVQVNERQSSVWVPARSPSRRAACTES